MEQRTPPPQITQSHAPTAAQPALPDGGLDTDMEYALLALSLACGVNSSALGRIVSWLTHQGLPPDAWFERDTLNALPCHDNLRQRIRQWHQRHGGKKSATDSDAPTAWYRSQLKAQGWRMVPRSDPAFPVLLNEIPDCPGVLFIKGNGALLNQPQVAMVGSRSPSADGQLSAKQLAQALASQGVVVTSGLALGVDQAAHEATLAHGQTIAVLGSGAGDIYPKRNLKLANRIVAQGGALVTEFPPGLPPQRQQFPLRNRVISGMAMAVIVVEAAIKSGSLITARLAAQQGREVFAVPGSIHNPLSRGCHQLIKEGAQLMDSLEDLTSALEGIGQLEAVVAQAMAREPVTASEQNGLMRYFTGGMNTLDDLVDRSGQQAATLLVELAELEMQGLIVRVAGGYIKQGV